MGVNEITFTVYCETEWYLRSKERLGRTCVLCGLVHHLQYCLMSTELYNEIHKDMAKTTPLLVRHNLSPHSLNKFLSILPRWRHPFIIILFYQYIISLDLNTLSKLNPRRASEYLCWSERLQIVQLGAERFKSFIGPTLAQDRDTQRNTVSQVVDLKGVVSPPTHCYWSRLYTVRKPYMYL
jgi:hypothetical protein